MKEIKRNESNGTALTYFLSELFSIPTTLHADGSKTTTGDGTSEDTGLVDYGFSGGGTHTTTQMMSDATTIAGETESTHNESGSQHGTTFLHSDWALDPDGAWRAAASHRIDSGLTNGQYESHLNVTPAADPHERT